MKENGDTPDKKRRKLPTPTVTSPGATSIKSVDVYKSVCTFEEAEADKRDATPDKQLFHETCNAIRTLMDEIAILKRKGTPEARGIIMEKCTEASLHFVMLKKLNRLEKLRTKQSRDELHRVKSQVDSQHLQLQNLLYEVLHLEKEVKKCLQFKSQDEEIDLVPLEDFMENAPDSVKKSRGVNDAHELQKARLEWELQQRRQLAEMCKQLQSEKGKVAQDIEKQQQHLENLDPMLRNILQTTKPLEESLGLKIEDTRHQHQYAYLLPQPLFFLYVQADAHHQASDPLLTVTVAGDEEDARRLKQSLSDSKDDDDSDSDDQEMESTETNKRHHRKRSTKVDRQEERRKRLLTKHPLVVHLTVSLKDGNKVNLEFAYLINLNIVTVKTSVNLSQPLTGVFASQLMTPESIINSLFENDNGLVSPNRANNYQLEAVGLSPFSELVPQLGNAFCWAQGVAGLDFINNANQDIGDAHHIKPQSALSQSSIPNIVSTIRQRFKARLALYHQVQTLESGSVLPIPKLSDLFPKKIVTHVSEFQQLAWPDYHSIRATQPLQDLQLVGENDFFYKLVLTRGTARIIAYIAVKANFPVKPPIFSLQLHWKGQFTSSDSDAVRDMEKEVNVYCNELMLGTGWAQTLLVAQVTRLMYCLDIFLESAAESDEETKNFPKEKMFVHASRGRDRARPFKFISVGGGVFTQR